MPFQSDECGQKGVVLCVRREKVVMMTECQKAEVAGLRRAGLGYTVIAKKMGMPRDTVRSFCRRNGLNGKMAGDDKERCRECGKPLVQTEGVKRRVFCCRECRVKWWHEHPEQIRQRAVYSFTCAGCGVQFTAYGDSRRKYCSHGCYIRTRFKGGCADG